MRNWVFCDDGEIERVLPLAREKGCGLEMQGFNAGNLDQAADILSWHLGLLEGFDGFRSMHGPFSNLCPGSFDPLIRQVSTYRMSQAINVANKLGAADVILHHGYVPNTSFPPDWIGRSCDYWRNILTLLPAEAHIHVENHLDRTPDILAEIIEKVDDPRLTVCFDVGHAYAFSAISPVDWIKRLGSKITYVHLHDNNGEEDQHLALGEGHLPLIELLEALETFAPRAVWAIEADVVKSMAWLKESKFHSLANWV